MTKDNTGVVPRHVGFILDGNRRWAQENSVSNFMGHKAGAELVHEIAEYAIDSGVQYITFYVFSKENWNRSKEEVSYLMGLMPILFKKYLHRFHERVIRVRWFGNYDGLSKKEIKLVDDAVEQTKNNTKGNVGFCFNYGGKDEIVDAVNDVIKQGSEVTTESITEHLYEPDVPDLDILVRTSGEQRISNFMMWRSAYAELLFMDKHWPEVTSQDVTMVIEEYLRRQRRFGC